MSNNQGSDTSYRIQWQPPPRPEWVQRINEEGETMNLSGVVPLDERSLLDAAMRATGLSDFGSDEWREPFSVAVRALEEEADLNLMGRLWARAALLQLLENRLRVEDTFKRHPEIEDEEIRQPIIVLGQSRSGTSFLLNVLAANPDNGATMQWEAIFPCPPPDKATYHTDPRIEKAHRIITRYNRVTPTIASMYEFSAYVPMEDCELLALTFLSNSFIGGMGQIPSYDAYVAKQDLAPALLYHKRVLKLLQWKNPRKHWVLKDPMHIDRIQTLLRIYPDACFVWPHRDPVRALASVVDLMGTIQWGRCDHPFKNASYEFVTNPEITAARFNAVIDQLESGALPKERLFSMQFRELTTHTMKVIEDMYRYFGLTLSEEGRSAMERYVREHPRDKRPPHQFAAGDAAAVARTRAAYARYQRYFNIPNED
jgi:hypothetical protein